MGLIGLAAIVDRSRELGEGNATDASVASYPWPLTFDVHDPTLHLISEVVKENEGSFVAESLNGSFFCDFFFHRNV
jgi:hypothetical protein